MGAPAIAKRRDVEPSMWSMGMGSAIAAETPICIDWTRKRWGRYGVLSWGVKEDGRMTRWREATNATNPYQPVGERRSCQMTEPDSDRARARALNIYLAVLVVDGRGGCLVSTLRSCPEGPGKVKLGARHFYQLATPRAKPSSDGAQTTPHFQYLHLFWFLLVDVEYTPTRNFMCPSLFYLEILCS